MRLPLLFTSFLLVGTVLCGSKQAFGQIRFDASQLFMDRTTDSDFPAIVGPDGVDSETSGYSAEPGFRLSLGVGINEYEVDASYSRINKWKSSRSGTLLQPLVLDDSASNPIVSPTPVNELGFLGGLYQASTAAFPEDETLESERLRGGSAYSISNTSEMEDFQINFGTNRDLRWWRVAAGFRSVHFDDSMRLRVTGDFDALDNNDAAVFGDILNDPNDGLSHSALVGSGLTLVSGPGDGWDAFDVPGTGPDILAITMGGSASNDLNGPQFTLAGRMFPMEELTLEFTGTAGAYYNRISGKVTERYQGAGADSSVYERVLRNNDSVTSFLGGLGFRGILALTDHLDLVGGYEATLITNLAQGSEQWRGVKTSVFDGTTYNAVAGNDIVVHGGHVGLALTW